MNDQVLRYYKLIIKNHMLDTCRLSDVNLRSRENDITYFESLWSSTGQELRRTLDFLCKNWDSQFPYYEQELEVFQDLLDSKIKSVQHFEKLFPGLVKVLEQVERSNEYKGSYKKVDLQDSVTDLLLKHYISDVSSRSQRSGNYYLRDQVTGQKVTLDEYIANCLLFRSSERFDSKWQQIFNKIEQQLVIDQQNVMESEFVREIEKERLLSVNCLGCCPFFYAGCNISNPAINSTPLVVLSSVSRIRQLESQLKDEVCLLLNGHGGVILFDCMMRSREVVPVGDIMSLHLKDEISQTIASYLQAIYPPLEPANFTVSFVPMVKNPLQGSRIGKKVIAQGSYENSYFQREYIEGVYVTRIKINPTVPERLYFWANDQKPIFPMKVGNNITASPGCKIGKLIKQRFKKYYVPENGRDADEMRFMSPRLSYFHDGECLRAELGIQVANPQIPRKPLQTFKNMSLIMARKADLATIKARLHKHGIACQIQNKFEQYRFKFSVNTAILYHNTRFDVLLSEVSHKKEFQFGGKYLTLLCVTPFIKLAERNARAILPEGDFLNIYNYFSKEFPPQALKLWRYSWEGDVEFYFRTGNRMQTIFLFYILNQLGERAMLKNPKNFDKLMQEDINKRFQLFYPRHEEHLQSALKIQLKVKPQ